MPRGRAPQGHPLSRLACLPAESALSARGESPRRSTRDLPKEAKPSKAWNVDRSGDPDHPLQPWGMHGRLVCQGIGTPTACASGTGRPPHDAHERASGSNPSPTPGLELLIRIVVGGPFVCVKVSRFGENKAGRRLHHTMERRDVKIEARFWGPAEVGRARTWGRGRPPPMGRGPIRSKKDRAEMIDDDRAWSFAQE